MKISCLAITLGFFVSADPEYTHTVLATRLIDAMVQLAGKLRFVCFITDVTQLFYWSTGYATNHARLRNTAIPQSGSFENFPCKASMYVL